MGFEKTIAQVVGPQPRRQQRRQRGFFGGRLPGIINTIVTGQPYNPGNGFSSRGNRNGFSYRGNPNLYEKFAGFRRRP